MRPPTERQRQCFEAFAKHGDHQQAARELGISEGCLKRQISQYYARIGARNGIQAGYLTWGRA